MNPPAPPVVPKLRTERLLLRPVAATDHLQVAVGLRHPDVYRYLSIRLLDDIQALQQMDWYAQWRASGLGAWWVVLLPETQTFIGVVGIFDQNNEHRRAELGYWIMPDYWRRGYAREAMTAVIRHSFEQRNVYRLVAHAEPANVASCRVAEVLGFHLESTQLAIEWVDGQPVDLATYVLLKPDWRV